MRFKTLKEGDVFNTRKKVNMHVECSGNFSEERRLNSVQKVGASENVVKTLSISENKSLYKYKWTPKQPSSYVLRGIRLFKQLIRSTNSSQY